VAAFAPISTRGSPRGGPYAAPGAPRRGDILALPTILAQPRRPLERRLSAQAAERLLLQFVAETSASSYRDAEPILQLGDRADLSAIPRVVGIGSHRR